jgi:hypothetical protein
MRGFIIPPICFYRFPRHPAQDRTGELVGSYMLRYMKMTWPEVKQYNIRVTGHGPIPKHYNAIMWYCLYLESIGMQLQCEEP